MKKYSVSWDPGGFSPFHHSVFLCVSWIYLKPPKCLEIQLSKSQLDKCIDVQTAVFGTGLTSSKDQEE